VFGINKQTNLDFDKIRKATTSVVAFFLHLEEFQAHGILPKSLWGILFSIITDYYASIISSQCILNHCHIHNQHTVTIGTTCQSMAEYVIHVFRE
jgi:hypothetical protein